MTRNEQIMAAIEDGESMASIGRRFGIGAERIRQIRINETKKAERAKQWYGELSTEVFGAIWMPLRDKAGRIPTELTEAEALTFICAIPRAEWQRTPSLGKGGLRKLEAWLEARGRMLTPPDAITTL